MADGVDPTIACCLCGRHAGGERFAWLANDDLGMYPVGGECECAAILRAHGVPLYDAEGGQLEMPDPAHLVAQVAALPLPDRVQAIARILADLIELDALLVCDPATGSLDSPQAVGANGDTVQVTVAAASVAVAVERFDAAEDEGPW